MNPAGSGVLASVCVCGAKAQLYTHGSYTIQYTTVEKNQNRENGKRGRGRKKGGGTN
jgi:hypothetical protein